MPQIGDLKYVIDSRIEFEAIATSYGSDMLSLTYISYCEAYQSIENDSKHLVATRNNASM